jgi:hypothetical protein
MTSRVKLTQSKLVMVLVVKNVQEGGKEGVQVLDQVARGKKLISNGRTRGIMD